MKKSIVCLIAGIMVCSLVACGNDDNQMSTETDVQKEVVQYKELVDPRGKYLESTKTGESNPQIIDTVYETEDVVIADFVPTEMGYAVDPTGETDSTVGIQEALYDCFNAGGGTVFLPAGNYAISSTIYIPPYVTLRGDWQDPDIGTEYGTIISVWMEGEDYEGAGAFEIGGSAGVIGLTVYYPMQSLEKIIPYPYTFFVEENSVDRMLFTIKNVTIINGYRGIGSSSSLTHEQLKVDNFRGTCLLESMGVFYSSEVGSLSNIVISNKYWKEAAADCMNAVQPEMIDAYTKKYTTGIRLGDLDWSTFYNISIDNCSVGIRTIKGSRSDFSGTFYDLNITNCKQGILFDGLEGRWGTCIARSYIEGGITNNTEAKVKLCGVEVVGELKGINDKTFIIDEKTDLSEYEVDYKVSYQKPASNFWLADLPSGLDADATAKLQSILNQAGEKGGVVYVPGGLYCFHSPLTIPEGVELRGCASLPTREADGVSETDEPSIGTLFFCYYGDDATNGKDDQAFITLSGKNAGVNGIRIMYPENSTANGDYRSTYTVRGTDSGVYIVNSMIAGSAYGVDFSGCDNHYIEGVMTCCYTNTFLLGGKDGVLVDSLQNGTVLQRTKQPGLVNWITGSNIYSALFDTVLRVECDYVIVENAEDQTLCNAFIYGGKTLIKNVNSKNTFIMNSGSDNSGEGVPMIISDGGSIVGVNLLRSHGYSYDFLTGEMKLYNRMTTNEVGERTVERTQ